MESSGTRHWIRWHHRLHQVSRVILYFSKIIYWTTHVDIERKLGRVILGDSKVEACSCHISWSWKFQVTSHSSSKSCTCIKDWKLQNVIGGHLSSYELERNWKELLKFIQDEASSNHMFLEFKDVNTWGHLLQNWIIQILDTNHNQLLYPSIERKWKVQLQLIESNGRSLFSFLL